LGPRTLSHLRELDGCKDARITATHPGCLREKLGEIARRSKILGQYIKEHFAGKELGVFYQDDDLGKGGLAGISDEVPASSIVSTQPYQPGVTNVAPQITAPVDRAVQETPRTVRPERALR
jgi:hypothetical protein